VHIYISALNYWGGIFFRYPRDGRRCAHHHICGAHKLFRRFLDFSHFLTAISRKLWRYLETKMKNMLCFWKSNPFWRHRWKPHQNRPINHHTILVRTMSPSNEQRSGLGAWQTENKFVRPRWPYDMRPSARAEKYIRYAGP